MTTNHFLPEHVYDRLALELEALAVQQGARGPLDPVGWAMEFLSLAGVWPDSVKPTVTPETGPAVPASPAGA
ncbi:hypothetical protein FHG66_20150 [Rubellimicrobium rubrum]|uniref:Uncharacterized protein n=1 Tax=Rubellimicrobium rubrum TaxID=2585369 RepID=A0A5C4MKE6_9RHOB|nr:hypothetical protein [Rubellimicrobium rubrum]TNC45265.1 hypothetical protein FHG66_20150 [Rubellimicrobium rubrum]